jgi:hypothetical protein
MKKLTALFAATLAISLTIAAPVGAQDRTHASVSHAKIVQEKSFDDAPDATKRNIGWTRLVRTRDGYSATVLARGLKPGGVYTFWWVSPYEFDDAGAPIIPSQVFVARGAGRVIGANGTARVRMQATNGQLGIVGLPALDVALWHEMKDPLTSIVRIEIAYHGQADEAANDAELKTWLSDFWTGSACPSEGLNDGGQPHCPAYLAATHMP